MLIGSQEVEIVNIALFWEVLEKQGEKSGELKQKVRAREGF